MKKFLFVLLILATIISTGCCSRKESKSNLEVKSNADINSSEDAKSSKKNKLNEEAKSNKETNSNSITKSKEESKPKVEKKIIIDDKLEKTFTIKEINLEMVKCPAGSFMMGSPKEELGRDYGEKQHLVTITRSFYIGKYEITQEQYKSITGYNPSWFDYIGPNKPVNKVTWKNSKDFCDKLNQKYSSLLPKGYRFDLPTEAQWEYACRAGTKTSLNNGKNITTLESDKNCINLDEVAWYYKNASNTLHIVGQKKPNAWGIYDMHGNVAEWCRDVYDDYSDEEAIDPIVTKKKKVSSFEKSKLYKLGHSSLPNYVSRGGAYNYGIKDFRSAARESIDGNANLFMYGFRVALVPIE